MTTWPAILRRPDVSALACWRRGQLENPAQRDQWQGLACGRTYLSQDESLSDAVRFSEAS